MKKRGPYPREFKLEAVRLLRQENRGQPLISVRKDWYLGQR